MHSVRGRRSAAGPLAVPPPREERRANALAAPPEWLPRAPFLRDGALLALSLGTLLGAFYEILPKPHRPVVTLLRAAVTGVVVTAKRLVGIEGPILGGAPPAS
jgi:hypothetical protein